MSIESYRFVSGTCYFIKYAADFSEKVTAIFSADHRRLFPYRWDKKLGCWNECGNMYSIAYIRKLEKAGKVIYR